MSLTHEYLKKYSYNRTKQPPDNQEVQIIIGQNELQIEKRLEASIKSEFHSVQQERIETEIQNQEFHQNQMVELNEVNKSNELNQSLQKTVKNIVSRKKQIFESVNIQSIQQPLLSNKQERAFAITQQYNININLHQSPKVDKSIQIHESSIAPILKSQPIQNQNLHPFSQANKEISMYVDQSQSKEIEIDNNDKQIHSEFVESSKQIKVDFKEQNLKQSQDVQEVQDQVMQESKEQPFLQNQEMDFDYNKEEYLKVIDDYIEFIKINEYIDAQQIEAQILKYQYMTSKKLYLLVIEPLIITMKFEVIPENPFQKNCQTLINKIDYADFYDILKIYRKTLEQSDYVPGLSDFMHYQISQQTQFFLQIKKQQIQWNQSLYNALQACRIELSVVLQMYEQLNKENIYLIEADIDAFQQQLKQMNGNKIKIFQNLFNKYKKKTYFLLKSMKNNNFKLNLSKNHFDYENLKQSISLQLKNFYQELDNCQRPISTSALLHQLQIFQNLKTYVREAVECEFNLRRNHIHFEPIQISLLNEVLNIFQMKKITKSRNHLKAKVLLLQKKESFNWTLSVDVEKFELKRVKTRYQILQNFKQELIKENEDPRLIKSLNQGEQSYLNNILILTQYLTVKEMIKNQKIDLLSYPKSNFINEIKSQSFYFSELITETNQQIQAINQLNHYKFLEQVQDILSLDDYKKVQQQLQELKNILISNKFSSIIQNDLEMLLKFISLSLRFFPSDIEKVYIESETYVEMELQLGDNEQFILLSKQYNNQVSVKLLKLFEEFFEKKIRAQFQQLLQSLVNLSQKPLMLQNPLKVQKRIDLLYEYQKPDYQIHKYVDQNLVSQIEDEPNLREFFDLARGFFDHLAELVKEDNCFEDIDYANDKIISEIQQFEVPQNIDVNITDLSPLIQYHKNLQQYMINKSQILINTPIGLGIIVYQQYQSYLKACQDRIKCLQDCIELKINDIQAIEFIVFRVYNKTELVPIYQLHTQIQCFYSDYQSIQIPRYVNKKERKIILNQSNEQVRPQDIEIFVQSQNIHNVGIFIDDQLTIFFE